MYYSEEIGFPKLIFQDGGYEVTLLVGKHGIIYHNLNVKVKVNHNQHLSNGF